MFFSKVMIMLIIQRLSIKYLMIRSNMLFCRVTFFIWVNYLFKDHRCTVLTVKRNVALSAVHRLSYIAPWGIIQIQVAYDTFFTSQTILLFLWLYQSYTHSCSHIIMLCSPLAMSLITNKEHNFLSGNYSFCI